jgi:hypothetical protein
MNYLLFVVDKRIQKGHVVTNMPRIFFSALHIAYNTIRKFCQRHRQIHVEVFVKQLIYLQFGS